MVVLHGLHSISSFSSFSSFGSIQLIQLIRLNQPHQAFTLSRFHTFSRRIFTLGIERICAYLIDMTKAIAIGAFYSSSGLRSSLAILVASFRPLIKFRICCRRISERLSPHYKLTGCRNPSLRAMSDNLALYCSCVSPVQLSMWETFAVRSMTLPATRESWPTLTNPSIYPTTPLFKFEILRCSCIYYF